MSNYYDGLNQKLLEAIPRNARRVLELGCANGRLGQRYKELNRDTQWWGVDVSADAAKQAGAHLDRVFVMDLDQADLSRLEGGFDVVVIGDLLEHLRRPETLLESLHDLTLGGATIVCCLPNMSHVSVVQRLLCGDISYDAMGLLDQTHLRFFSQPSAFKTFLDTGWLPHLQDEYRVEVQRSDFAVHVLRAAHALGIPYDTALRGLGMYQMVLVCHKGQKPGTVRSGGVPFSVIVPVNRPWQYQLNLASSPGLQEVGAEVIVVEDARSAADAYEIGAAKAGHAWRVMVHQDVYFPRGSGHTLARKLAALTQQGRIHEPVGFAGLTETADGMGAEAGFVVDRNQLFSHGPSDCAVSIDELAIAMHREMVASIDASLGWHLWATDLCLQSRARVGLPKVPVIEVPTYHNSTNDYSVPEGLRISAQRLFGKYPGLTQHPSLCGVLHRRASGDVAIEPRSSWTARSAA